MSTFWWLEGCASPANSQRLGDMQLFSTQDLFSAIGALFEFLFSTSLGWIILLGIGATIAIDLFLPSRRRRKKPRKKKDNSFQREVLGLLVAGTFIWAILVPGSRSSEPNTTPGWLSTLTLVLVVGWGATAANWFRSRKRAALRERLQMDIDDMAHMSPDEFEELVADLFRARGNRAVVVGGLGDHGVDIEVTGRDGARALVQCKRYGHDRWVGEREVRDLYGAFTHDGNAARAYLVTTGFFSNAARAWAEGKPIVLTDGERLASAMRDVASGK
jgi:HJR/Mrr/RecB family endonuclease